MRFRAESCDRPSCRRNVTYFCEHQLGVIHFVPYLNTPEGAFAIDEWPEVRLEIQTSAE